MNLAFLIDDNYAEQLAVTLTSIFTNDRHGTKFNVYVLDTGISEANKAKICVTKGNYEISFIPVSKNLFANLPSIYHLKTLNYARLFLPSLVNCSRILFLDCDLLVLDDLVELYNTDFDGNYACVVRERLSDESYILKQIQKLGIQTYFNAGVMLLNLDKMRADNIEEKSLKFVQEEPEKILLLDQCVLNYVFQDKVKFVDKKWNYQYKHNVSKKMKKPAIIHFVGREKPFLGFAHPYENMYYKFLRLTPYKISFFEFKKKMWRMLLPKLQKRSLIILKCMI